MVLSKTVKKQVAKEILLFFSGVLIWSFFIAIIYGYNVYEKSTCQKLINQERGNKNKIDSLLGWQEIPLDTKSKDDPLGILDKKPAKFVPPPDAEEVKLPSQKEVLGDEVLLPPPPHKGKTSTSDTFDFSDIVREDSMENALVIKLKLENGKIDQELPKHQYTEDNQPAMIIIAFILVIVLYPLRFLFLIIWWAFKTVREPNGS